MVIVTENVPHRLRGFLSRLLLKEVGDGNAVMAWSINNECGFTFDTCGKNRRLPISIDDFPLISFLPENE